jgi:hypothetical protein
MTSPTLRPIHANQTSRSPGLPGHTTTEAADGHRPLSVLRVECWHDPVVEQVGFDPRSHYVETFWLPVLGPSTTLLFRRLAHRLALEPEGFPFDPESTAVALGLGGVGGRHSPFRRAIERGVRFGFAERTIRALRVRTKVGRVPRQQLERLHPSLQELHRRFVLDPTSWARAELVLAAYSQGCELLDAGMTPDAAEHDLAHNRIHPALAYAATHPKIQREGSVSIPVPPQLVSSASRVRTPNPVAPFDR